MTKKQPGPRLRPETRSRKLTPELRSLLDTGMDFFGQPSHLTPITRDPYGKIVRNFSQEDPTPGNDARIDFLRGEWKKHRDAVMAWHIEQNRDGSRPWSFWAFDFPGQRPAVLPSSGSPGDSARFTRERKLADINWLLDREAMSREEQLLVRQEEERLDELPAALGGTPSDVDSELERLFRNVGRNTANESEE